MITIISFFFFFEFFNYKKQTNRILLSLVLTLVPQMKAFFTGSSAEVKLLPWYCVD